MARALALRPSYWASVSGGKDSLFMLKIILDNPEKYPLDGVVHFELEIDFPFVKDVIDTMEEWCKGYNIPFLRIKPRKSWYELYDKYGFPNRISRWCNSKYKLDSQQQLNQMMRENGKYVVWYIGYCLDENKRYEKRGDKPERYPLVEEGINECEILAKARNTPVFNDYYKFNDRCGCMWCPLASYKNLAYLCKYYPAEYEQYIYMLKETDAMYEKKLGHPVSVKTGDPKYNTDYVDNIVRTKYLPRLEEQIKGYNEQVTFW